MSFFKLIAGEVTPNSIGMYVAIDRPWIFPGTGDELCLSAEAHDAEQVSGYIDELIQELEGLKDIAKRKFDGWQRRKS